MFSNKSLCWFYNERHHGKDPVDGVDETIKNVILRKVKSGHLDYLAGPNTGIINVKYVADFKLNYQIFRSTHK